MTVSCPAGKRTLGGPSTRQCAIINHSRFASPLNYTRFTLNIPRFQAYLTETLTSRTKYQLFIPPSNYRTVSPTRRYSRNPSSINLKEIPGKGQSLSRWVIRIRPDTAVPGAYFPDRCASFPSDKGRYVNKGRGKTSAVKLFFFNSNQQDLRLYPFQR
jgi:hypothetical protein